MSRSPEYPSLTIRQVADRLGVHEGTLYRMLRNGTAPASYKIGKRRLFKEQDVLDWLEAECREAA